MATIRYYNFGSLEQIERILKRTIRKKPKTFIRSNDKVPFKIANANLKKTFRIL